MFGLIAMSSIKDPMDFCFCTGIEYSVQEIIDAAFDFVGLRATDFLKVSNSLVRVYEPEKSRGDAALAATVLNWHPKACGKMVIEKMVSHRIKHD
jgi:GDP-D-mannose dehydratase